ncbi:MAG: FtsX-like permease family protein [Bacillota bacterium]
MLLRKLLRDIVTFKGQFFAIALLVMLGIAMFSSMYLALVNLRDSAENSFHRLRLADYTVQFAAAPAGLTEAARAIEGVRLVSGRYVDDVSLDLPGAPDKMRARIISLPGPGEDPVNDLHLVRGRLLDPDDRRGVLISSDFATHHQLEPGDPVHVIVGGLRQELVIRGLILSPEYLFAAPDLNQFFSSIHSFAIMFVTRDTAAEVLGSGGQINELAVTTDPEADAAVVEQALRELTSGYGYRTLVAREDQFSYRMLQSEMDQLSTWSVMLPVVFLGAAVMVILVLLARIVRQQRSHIGLLRALGYTRAHIMGYYLGFALAVGGTGSVAGTLLGYWMSVGLTNQYAFYFNIPYLVSGFHWDVQLFAVAMGVGTCLVASFFSARAAASIHPVEAMRAPAPPPGRRFWGERWFSFMDRLPALWKFPIRNITRNPWRFNFSAAGVGVALGLLVLSGSFYDLFDDMLNRYFGDMVGYEARINFTGPTGWDAVTEVALWPEVREAQALVEGAVRYRNGRLQYEGPLTGLPEDGRLFQLRDEQNNLVAPSRGGILLSSNLMQILDLKEGDTVTLEPMVAGLPSREVTVAGTVETMLGVGGFLPLEEARFVLGPGTPISAALVTTNPGTSLETLRERARDRPFVSGVQSIADAREEALKNLDLMYAFLAVALLFSMLLAGAIVYSMSSITTLERTRELVSFRMQGMSRKGTGVLIAAEGLLPAVPGLVLGVAVGYAWAAWFAAAFSSDLMTIRLVIYPATIVFSVLAVVAAVALAQCPPIRSTNRINLAEASKHRE